METLSSYYYIASGDIVYDACFDDDYSYYRKVSLCEPLPKERHAESSAAETSKVTESSEDAEGEER